MDDLERQRRLRLERDALSFDTPNCPDCLRRMVPVETDGETKWECPHGGHVAR